MNFDDLHRALASAIRRAGLPTIPFEDVQLDLGSLDRIARFALCPERRVSNRLGRYLGPAATVGFRWRALDTVRQRTSEQDVVGQLLGRKAQMRRTRTQPMSIHLDLRLSASVVNGGTLSDPGPAAWRRWRTEIEAEFGDEQPLVDLDGNDIDEDGNLYIQAWQGKPQATVACAIDGSFGLVGSRSTHGSRSRSHDGGTIRIDDPTGPRTSIGCWPGGRGGSTGGRWP